MSRAQSLTTGLLKARDSQDVVNINDILDALDEETITYTILRETKLGKICGALRKHADPDIGNKAKALVLKWKEQVGQAKKGNRDRPRNSNSAEQAPRQPPPPAAPVSTVSRPRINTHKGDVQRDKVVEKLTNSLQPDEDDEKLIYWVELAVDIEEQLWAQVGQHGNERKNYLKRFRDINFNLKDANNGLKQNLLSGTLRPRELATMSTEELASETLKAARSEEKDWMLKEAQGGAATEQKAMTDDFKCGKCKQRKCTYYQQQTRGADEPMTTFIRCIVCGNQWKN